MIKVSAMKKKENKISITEENLAKGIEIIGDHKIFKNVRITVIPDNKSMGKNDIAIADHRFVYVNPKYYLEPQEWVYVIAHAMLHLILGHFDKDKLPGYEIVNSEGKKEWKPDFDKKLWSAACDLYIAKFQPNEKNYIKDLIDFHIDNYTHRRVSCCITGNISVANALAEHRLLTSQFHLLSTN